MDIKELREKLNKKHVKVRVPKIYGESYAVSYAKMLKDFTDNIVENFGGLVMAVFELTRERASAAVLDSSVAPLSLNDRSVAINDKSVIMDEAGDFDFWDKFLEDNKKKKEKKDNKKYDAWKDLLKIINKEIDAEFSKTKKEPVDYTSSLSSLFDYYTGKAELLAREWTDKELNNLYRYVYGSYKKEFPNLSVSGEYYEQIMNAVINENMALIKSIPQEVLKEMQVVLSQGIISGNQKELVKNLKRIKGVSKDRAVFIARDQIHKAVESFKQVQNTALGIEYYEWLTAEDERVSSGLGGHRQNNHRVFKYSSNEAIISWSSKRGFYHGKPGDRPNCRCIAVGVILDIDEKIIKASDGYGYQIVKK